MKRLDLLTLGALLLSFLLHGLALLYLYQFKEAADIASNQVVVSSRVLSVEELDQLINQSNNTVKNEAQKTKESSDEAYLSDRTAKVEKETVARGRVGDGAKSERERIAQEVKKQMRFGISSTLEMQPEAPLSNSTGIIQGDVRASVDLLKSDVAHGVQTLLNTVEFKYASFYNRIKDEIAPRWQPEIEFILKQAYSRISEGIYVTEIEIETDANGKVTEIDVIKSSNVTDFDEAAVNSFWDLGNLTNLPKGLVVEDRYQTKFSFIVQVSKKGFRFETESELDKFQRKDPRRRFH